MILAGAGLFAGVTVAATAVINARLDAQQDEIARQIATARGLGKARDANADSAVAAERELERRKKGAPVIALTLENLSQILPDHTYLTELSVENNKLRLIGVSGDAPALIGLIERSGLFTRASFFAPTTRSPSESGERFHIEAVIQPFNPSRS